MAKQPFCGFAESGGAPLHLVTAVASSGPSQDFKRPEFVTGNVQIEAVSVGLTTRRACCPMAELELSTSLHSV